MYHRRRWNKKPQRQERLVEVIRSQPGSPLSLARDAAHQAFDQIWKSGLMTRPQAYAWLAMKLDLPTEYCHMSQFDIRTCREVKALCEPFRESLIAQEFEEINPDWSDLA